MNPNNIILAEQALASALQLYAALRNELGTGKTVEQIVAEALADNKAVEDTPVPPPVVPNA